MTPDIQAIRAREVLARACEDPFMWGNEEGPPSEGKMDWLEREITAAIKAAVAEEREACFDIAANAECGSSTQARFIAGAIATAIRERTP